MNNDRSIATTNREEIGDDPEPAGQHTTGAEGYGASPDGSGQRPAPWDDHLTEASTDLARVFGEIFDANDQRHRQASEAISRLDAKQQKMAQVTDKILNNQKDSVRCYRELMERLAAIRKEQDELKTICQQNDSGYAKLRKLILVGSAVQLGVIVLGAGTLALVLMLG